MHPGYHIGILPSGESKDPDKTGVGNHAQFRPRLPAVSVCVCVCVCVHACMCVCMCVCVYVCMCACVCVHVIWVTGIRGGFLRSKVALFPVSMHCQLLLDAGKLADFPK